MQKINIIADYDGGGGVGLYNNIIQQQ